MNIKSFAVRVNGKTVAHLHLRDSFTWLTWQTGYWDDPDRPVLGLRFEENPEAEVKANQRLPPWFSNLLPEGILRQWVAEAVGISEQREMPLLVRLGTSLPGAVTIVPAEPDVDPTWQPQEITPPPPPTHGDGRFRFSLAGVALKFSMLQQGDRLTMPADGGEGDWIVKMPDATYPEVPVNEFTMMTLARHCGIEVPEIRLVHRDDLWDLPDAAWPRGQDLAYAIRRFDRTGNHRIHIEDLAQVRNFYPEDKYLGSFETAAALVRRGHDDASYLEFVRRLFFSCAIGNGDMHLKNTSLIYRDPRRPVISPVYDLVSTIPYVAPAPDDLGLRLGRSRRFEEVTPASFEVLARRIGASPEATMAAVAEVSARLPEAWHRTTDLLAPLPRHRTWLEHRIPEVSRRFSG
ncbi:type II toxin-antitoxin system HipA family toxin [Arachnia propionica]|uniref:Type II toxin-antitoxin system HipA family toxin n=1 Tax=Arachnia propionica TaxID=1750 RepID=A0A3P1T268_9ACTN|nr:HipA domain-containing protein [Arachnia propionica]RRD03375.1 type II toxin-antitoxin system HipA family toxin [Arachnia propionica]